MLKDNPVFATIAVRDGAAAEKFYSEMLELTQIHKDQAGTLYQSGSSKLYVYESPNGGQNPATSASWEVSDIEAIVEDLKTRGVTFEHYDELPTEWQGDIAVMGPIKSAWFKDPDGNILAVSSIN